jgi:hypothetical protein
MQLTLISYHKDGATGFSKMSGHTCHITLRHIAKGPPPLFFFPQVPDKQDIINLRMVVINVLNNQLLTAERGCFFRYSLLPPTTQDLCFGWVHCIVHVKDL